MWTNDDKTATSLNVLMYFLNLQDYFGLFE